MSPESPRIAVVILHYKSVEDTLVCLDSVAGSTVQADWIIMVNNGNDDIRGLTDAMRAIGRANGTAPFVLHADTVEDVRVLLEKTDASYDDGKLFYIKAESNRGYGAGNNLGLTLALGLGADAVWLLNNDTKVAPGALAAMRDKLFSDSSIGLCGPLIQYMDSPGTVQCRGGGWTNPWTCLSNLNGYHFPVEAAFEDDEAEIEADLNFIYGSAVMASRDFLTTVGLMDERFFIYCEEQDWAFRMGGRFTLAYASKAHVWHREGVSTGWPAKAGNPFAVKHLIRSRLLLARKHNPAALPVVCLSIAFAIIRGLYRRVKKGVAPSRLPAYESAPREE